MQLTEHAIVRYRERILGLGVPYAEAEARLRAAVEFAVPLRETMRDKGRDSDKTYRYGIDDPPCVLLVIRDSKGLAVKTVITEEMDRRNSQIDLATPPPTGQVIPPRRALSAMAHLADHFTERSQQGDPHASDLAGAFRRLREAFVDAPPDAAEASAAAVLRYYQLIAGTVSASWRKAKLDAIVAALEEAVPASARACEDAEVVAFAEATSALCLALSQTLAPGSSDQRSWSASAGVWSAGARSVRALLGVPPAPTAAPAVRTACEALAYLGEHRFEDHMTLPGRDARDLASAFQRLTDAFAEAPARARETPAGALRHGFALLAERAKGKGQDKLRAIVAALDLVVPTADRLADPDPAIVLWEDIRLLCAARARAARVGTAEHRQWSASGSVWAEGTRTLQGLRRARLALGAPPPQAAALVQHGPGLEQHGPGPEQQVSGAVLGEHVTWKPAPAAPDLGPMLFGRLEALLSGIPVRRMRLLRLGWADTCLNEHGIPMEPGTAQAWLAQRLVKELRQHPQGVRIALTRLIEWADAGLSLTAAPGVDPPYDLRAKDLYAPAPQPPPSIPAAIADNRWVCPCGAEAHQSKDLIHRDGCLWQTRSPHTPPPAAGDTHV